MLVIGGHIPALNASSFLRLWTPILAHYLNMAIPSVGFKLIAVDYDDVNTVENLKPDFVFEERPRLVCLERVGFYAPLAAQQGILGKTPYAQEGAVVYWSNPKAKIADLRNKKVGFPMRFTSPYLLARELFRRNGLHIYANLSEVIFYDDYHRQLKDYWAGRIDAGVVPTGFLETYYLGHNLTLHKGPEAVGFPFATSTDLLPLHGFSAGPNVTTKLRERVLRALLDLEPRPEALLYGFTIAASDALTRALMWSEDEESCSRHAQIVCLYDDPIRPDYDCPSCPAGLECACSPCPSNHLFPPPVIYPWQVLLILCCVLCVSVVVDCLGLVW